MTTLSLPAPAKLNLFLHINGRREDGYHELETLFQFIDIADQLHFSLEPSGELSLTPAIPGVAAQDNLIIRAASLLKQQTGSSLGAHIALEKNLPMGGGIGGGSSDAATTLLGLNQLWQTQLSLDQLAELGRQLGADVPVFVRGRAAIAQGIGEHLTPVEISEPWYLVLVPEVQVSTQQAFADPELVRDTPKLGGWPVATQLLHNDFEAVVCKRYPAVEKALHWLLEYAPARMTGTGCCVFAPFDNEADARRCLAQKPAHLHGFVAKGCNISPLHQQLSR